jgi:ABC-type antimicrobial peptide transport system permease subunit
LGALFGTVALATALNSSLFSVVDGLLFRPLPFPQSDLIAVVDYRSTGGTLPPLAYEPGLAQDRDLLRQRLETSPFITASSQAGSAVFFERSLADAVGVRAHGVSASFFALFGLVPERGSLFTATDEERVPAAGDASNALPIVVSHAFWRDRLGGAAVPVETDLAGRRVRVLGVLRGDVKVPGETNVWAPVWSSRPRPASFVRLKSLDFMAELRAAFPQLTFTPLRDAEQPAQATGVILLWGASGALLLMTWIQVAGLMFANSVQRVRAMGIRLALGARRRDLIRAALGDAVFVNVAAGLVAWLLAYPLCAFILSRLPDELRYGRYLTPDVRTAIFTAALCLAGTLLTATLPFLMTRGRTALHLIRGEIGAGRFSVSSVQRILLATQVGLTAFLVYSSGLAAQSLTRALSFDYGFDTERVLVFEPPAWSRVGMSPKESFGAFAEHNRKIDETLDRLRASKEVLAAAPLQSAPLGLGLKQELLPLSSVDGVPRSNVSTRINYVGKDFVAAIGATITGGRDFDAPEFAGNQQIALVNEAFAAKIVPVINIYGSQVAPSVVGKEITVGPVRAKIIGVIKNLVDSGPATTPDPQVFLPLWTSGGFLVALRTRNFGEPSLEVRAALEGIWGRLPSGHLRPMLSEVSHTVTPYRAQSVLLGIVVVCCLPIAAIGIAGAVAHAVATRSHEVALRLALGANPSQAMWTVVSAYVVPLAGGVIAGCLLGIATGHAVNSRLFQTEPADPAAAVFAVALLTLVAGLSAWPSARRAALLNPAVLLRRE